MNQWKKAELKVQSLLMANAIQFDDVSGNPEYWAKDIDIIAHTEKGDISIEVKNDSWIHKTGNLFLETLSDVAQKKEGWFKYTEANLLYYLDDKNNFLYIYDMEKLKGFVDEQSAAYLKLHTKQCRLDKYKISEGICVPQKDIEHLCKGVLNLNDELKG